jgi:uncharacterized protein
MATVRSRRRAGTTDARNTSPSPFTPPWTPRPAQFGTGVHHNVAVPMSDGVVLRADIHYPTVPETGRPAAGPFPVLLSMTPYGKKAPPPAAQIGGGATPYLIKRGYIEAMVDVRGSGVSGGSFQMFGERQTQDGIERSSGRRGCPTPMAVSVCSGSPTWRSTSCSPPPPSGRIRR